LIQQALNIQLDLALLFVNLGDRGNNAQDDGFYFSINYGLSEPKDSSFIPHPSSFPLPLPLKTVYS
ncbi:MAG TPA: hypothetical protein DDZ80_14145, partial [Cyanobacteria bacterium UBA8803]|nr:hypothetical protein [Cyanobacteria bacterium UBA8803]